MSVLNVGADQQYRTIGAAVAAAQDGDTIAVEAGTYTNDFVTITKKLTIAGVDGMVNVVATEAPPNGKAIFVTTTDVTIDHLAFSGSRVADGNGAGIRYEGGNLTVTNSYFHDNENGILGGAVAGGTVTIRNSEFAHNGSGDGRTHNLYIGDIATLRISDSYFHDAVIGHEIKSRAQNTIIENSRIVDGATGTASYSIDLPNGGNAVIRGNVIEQGPHSDNPAIIHFGGEGAPHAGSSLAITGNTILNDMPSSSAVALRNATDVTATMTDNHFWGLGAEQIAAGPASQSGNDFLATEPTIDGSSPWAAATPTPSPVPTPVPTPVPSPVPTPEPTPVPTPVPTPEPTPVPTPAPSPEPVPTPSPTPSHTPAPSPAPAPGSSKLSTIVVHAAEDAWNGDAQFRITVDGKQVAGVQTVHALHSEGAWDTFTFTGDFGGSGPSRVAIQYINDAVAGPGMDRNLYIKDVLVNGNTFAGTEAISNTGLRRVDPHSAELDSNGIVTFETHGSPPAAHDPSPPPKPGPNPNTAKQSTITLHVAEDAWNGHAQFIVTVDGKQVGGVNTVHASHAEGHWDTFTLTGNFGNDGPSEVAVTYVNDAVAGPNMDRNLFVRDIVVNGKTILGTEAISNTGLRHADPHSAELDSNGTVTFDTHGSPPGAAKTPVASAATTAATQSGSMLTGEAGTADLFSFGDTAGHHVVTGFEPGLDKIALKTADTGITAESLAAHESADAAGSAVLHLGQHEVTLAGIQPAQVHADWFVVTH